MNKQEKNISPEVLHQITILQQNEVTEYHIYKHLSRIAKSNAHTQALNQLAAEELEHYRFLMQYGDEIDPRWSSVKLHEWMAAIFGLGFSLRMLEKVEQKAMENYQNLAKAIPEASKIAQEEQRHLHQLAHIASEVRGRVSNTWIVGFNLAFFVLWSWLIFSVALPLSAWHTAVLGVILVLTVSVADMVNTTLLRHSNKVKLSHWLRPAGRSSATILFGGIVHLPLFLMQSFVIGLTFSLGLLLMVTLSVNLYFAVVNELSLVSRVYRSIAGFSITAALAFLMQLLLSIISL